VAPSHSHDRHRDRITVSSLLESRYGFVSVAYLVAGARTCSHFPIAGSSQNHEVLGLYRSPQSLSRSYKATKLIVPITKLHNRSNDFFPVG